MERYSRNIGALSPEENDKVQNSKVCVIGCGGLGGYVVEMLGRIGVSSITAVDKDVFKLSNLNRQLLSNEINIGKEKVFIAQERMRIVNSSVQVDPIYGNFTKENGKEIISGHDVIVDCLDNVQTRLILQELSEESSIPFVHGAIGGWYGQATTIFPGDRTLNKIYRNIPMEKSKEKIGTPTFGPPLIASIQVSEVIKILTGRGELLRKKLLFINVLENEYNVIHL